MKQQQHDDTALYQQLRGAFEMSPEQKLRVEQEILRRAAAAKPVTVQTAQSGNAGNRIRQSAGGAWRALRGISLAACLVLVCAGAFFLHRGLTDPADSLSQQSSVEMEELTTLPAETVTGTSVTTTAATAVPEQKQTAAVPVSTAVTRQTEAVTESAAETQAYADHPAASKTETSVQMTDITQTTAKMTTVQTTATTVTTTAVTTTTSAITSETAENLYFYTVAAPEQANIMIPDTTVHAGETVTIPVRFNEDLEFAGIQLYLLLESDSGAEMPELSAEVPDRDDSLLSTLLNVPDNQHVNIVYADGIVTKMRADSDLVWLTLRIPEHAAPGTVYTFSAEDYSRAVDGSGEAGGSDSIPLRAYFGTITVN